MQAEKKRQENETYGKYTRSRQKRGEKKTITRTMYNKRKKKKRRQKQQEYATQRKTLISVENGLRTLNVASLNPDSMREKDAARDSKRHNGK